MKPAPSLTVTLAADEAEAVRDAVARGDYSSADEAVRDAVRLLEFQRSLGGFSVDEIRRAWQEGIDSGFVDGPLDVEAIKRKGQALLERKRGEPAA